MDRFMRFGMIIAAAVALVACGGGDSEDSASDLGSGRWALSISGATLENFEGVFGNATIQSAEFRIDGRVVSEQSYSNPTKTALFLVDIESIYLDAGNHVLEFRITAQTKSPTTYAINPAGFVYARDTQGTANKVVALGTSGTPRTATLQTGQAIMVTFSLP